MKKAVIIIPILLISITLITVVSLILVICFGNSNSYFPTNAEFSNPDIINNTNTNENSSSVISIEDTNEEVDDEPTIAFIR